MEKNILVGIQIIPSTNGFIIKNQFYDVSNEQQVEDLICIEGKKDRLFEEIKKIIGD